MDYKMKKMLDAIREEKIEKIDKHETVISDDYERVQIKIMDSTKITLTNGDVIIYISHS